MSLFSTLTSIVQRPKKRVGRGYGSGKGSHTSSRGTKGQLSRTGAKVPLWFEGGQLPLIKRLPMLRGKSRLEVLHPAAELTLAVLNRMKADTISVETLKLEGVIDKRFKKAKVIAGGEITRAITLTGIGVSATAREAIIKAGGKVT